jgi:hypothetical protein
MAATKGTGTDRTEKLAGRDIVIPGDGGAHYWKETGEVVTPEERAFLMEIAAPETGLDFKGAQKQNPDLIFYSYEVQVAEGEAPKPNVIRGLVIDMFQRPDNFDTATDGDEDGGGKDRLRVACFVKLTRPCYVKGRNKKVRLANIGETVWVDLNQATSSIVRIAAPRRDPKTQALCGLAEIAIEPKFKEPYQYTNPKGKTETRQAWRVNVYGGFNGGPTFKKYTSAEEIAKKLGQHIATPSLVSDVEIARTLGVALPGSIEAPQLPPASES